MSTSFQFPPPSSLAFLAPLREEVRVFIREQLGDYPAHLQARSWTGYDPNFSRAMGKRGWIGMTWPKEYGGHARSSLERYVVVEEMLAAGAPVAAHWIADRQSGPLLLKHGTETQKRELLPRIAAGECYICIGMSEPNSGSDLAAARTRAVPENGGFRINGTKLWTTLAQHSHYMVLFCRTESASQERHGGTSQLLVDLKTPGVTVRPIVDMLGQRHFNEVVFENAFVPGEALLGRLGNGWNQVMSELAFERSGPERFLSSFALLNALAQTLRHSRAERVAIMLGRIISHLAVLRRLSLSVAGMLERDENPAIQAALVKDLGASIEQEIPEIAHQLLQIEPALHDENELSATLAWTLLSAPAFSLRGGTREILRGIIARSLGLR
jgi:alkylation response protein AidB-like acyl-CoA dehydrogenase